jgi:hypothetical protein
VGCAQEPRTHVAMSPHVLHNNPGATPAFTPVAMEI